MKERLSVGRLCSRVRLFRNARLLMRLACAASAASLLSGAGWTGAVADDRPLLLAQGTAGQVAPPSQFSGPPGLIPRTPQGAVPLPVPVPVPVPVPGYYGAPVPYGYGAYPYGGYGYPYGYPGSQPFGNEPYTGPKAGHIQLVVDPVDAQVFIDGHEVKQQSDFTYVVNLLEGQHRLQIAREGYKPYDQPLDVPGGGGFVLAVRLEK